MRLPVSPSCGVGYSWSCQGDAMFVDFDLSVERVCQLEGFGDQTSPLFSGTDNHFGVADLDFMALLCAEVPNL